MDYQNKGVIEKYFYKDLKKAFSNKFPGEWDDEKESHLQWMLSDTAVLADSCRNFIKTILDDLPKHDDIHTRIQEMKIELNIK